MSDSPRTDEKSLRPAILAAGVLAAAVMGQGTVSAAPVVSVMARAALQAAAAGTVGEADSRAERLRAMRRARGEALAEPERETVEDGLYKLEANYLLERLQAGWHGLHPVFGGLPTGSGLGLGFRLIDDAVGKFYVDSLEPNRVSLAGGAVGSFKGYVVADGTATLHRIGGSSVGVTGWARYRRFTQEDFFGLGPDTVEADRVTYLFEDRAIGAEAFWQAPEWLRLGVGVADVSTNTGPGTDDRFPSIEERFTEERVPGLRDQPSFLRTDGFVEIDWRDARFNPRAGGFYSIRLSQFDQREEAGEEDRFDFRRYTVELHQYFPFLHKHRVVALRARAVLSDTDAGQQVPFYFQPDLGGSTSLRGFRERRFRGRNSILLTAEYRWEAWIGLDMALFVDTGNVFDERSDLFDVDDYRTAYGVGFRFNTAKGVFLRIDVADSTEGFKTYFTFDHAF